MDSGDAPQLLILLIMLALSAFFSASETALTGVSRIRMLTLAEDGNKRAKTVNKLLDNQPKMLSAILIGNNIANISASSLATVLVTKQAVKIGMGLPTGTVIGIATGVLTVIILIFGEITPKNMATVRAERIAMKVAPAIAAITKVLTPVIAIVNFLSRIVMRFVGVDPEEDNSVMTEGDFRTVLDVSQQDGVLETEEKELITNVVDFGDTVASSVMVPRLDVTFIDVDSTYAQTQELFRAEKYTRIPVFEEDKDNVVGILNLKDVFCFDGRQEDFHIRDIMREAVFTYEFKNTAELMMEMRKDRISIEVVLDEYGAVAGILTMEDLLEEIVGEIRDEYDEEETDDIQKLSDTRFLVDGNTRLEDINELLELELESEDYESISGHMIHELGHIPTEGEKINISGIIFKIYKMEKRSIESILVDTTNRH